MAEKKFIHVIEVGLRDGMQMEPHFVPTERKLAIARSVIASGVRRLEATSFVAPRAIPALADAADVVSGLRGCGATLTALVPNAHGATRAAQAGADEISVFVSASETHNGLNVNRTIAQSLAAISDLATGGRGMGVALRGAIPTAFGCPFEGDISTDQVGRVVAGYVAAGISRITLGDTTGMATPALVTRLCRHLQTSFPQVQLTLHFHNTRGLGLVNVMAGLACGIEHFESAFGGLGGCPFAAGASGNICTEDLVNLLHEEGYETGIDLNLCIATAEMVEAELALASPGRRLPGQVMKAGPRSRLHSAENFRRASAR